MPQPQHGWTAHTPLRTPSRQSVLWDRADDATVTDATDPALADLRRRVIDPVVQSVLRPAELGRVLVYQHPDTEDLLLLVTAADGETLQHHLTMDSVPPLDLPAIAERLAEALEDFVAESRFGWGQQRIARYVIPPA